MRSFIARFLTSCLLHIRDDGLQSTGIHLDEIALVQGPQALQTFVSFGVLA